MQKYLSNENQRKRVKKIVRKAKLYRSKVLSALAAKPFRIIRPCMQKVAPATPAYTGRFNHAVASERENSSLLFVLGLA
jgi:hypothetical protein